MNINAFKTYDAENGVIIFTEPPSGAILEILKKNKGQETRCVYQAHLEWDSREHLLANEEGIEIIESSTDGWVVKNKFFAQMIQELVDHIGALSSEGIEVDEGDWDDFEAGENSASQPLSPAFNLRVFVRRRDHLKFKASARVLFDGAMAAQGRQSRRDAARKFMDFMAENKIHVWSDPEKYAIPIRTKIIHFHWEGLSLSDQFMTLFPWDPIPEMTGKERAKFFSGSRGKDGSETCSRRV
jgi:hypothetical protein